MTLAELLKTMPAPTTPSNGDPAFTRYRGCEWVGQLINNCGGEKPNAIKFDRTTHSSYGPHHQPIIYVGYDHQPTWDRERGMWNAPADAD